MSVHTARILSERLLVAIAPHVPMLHQSSLVADPPRRFFPVSRSLRDSETSPLIPLNSLSAIRVNLHDCILSLQTFELGEQRMPLLEHRSNNLITPTKVFS